ncbi:MAG TPA: HXXEE domain-containing protein [Pyrinomonadaceae bacterium]|nr:HXXEE domain-containing protein [Pyrinomonadaceae bacterium]
MVVEATVATSRKTTSEWTLWVVAVSCALHVAEEYFTGWQPWARETLGIVMPTARFLFMNVLLVLAAVVLASVGWKRPTLSLIIPAATLVNAIFFHLLPTIVQGRVSPGVYTAVLLYLPFSSWAFVGARRDGVPRRAMAVASVVGALMMTAVVLTARWLSP